MAEVKLYMSGFLRKRQRGKHIKSESQRKNLKFQERYCTLTEHSFTYSKKENVCSHIIKIDIANYDITVIVSYGVMQSKARGSFPAERIKVVVNTDPEAFKKGTLTSSDLCFQVTKALSLIL